MLLFNNEPNTRFMLGNKFINITQLSKLIESFSKTFTINIINVNINNYLAKLAWFKFVCQQHMVWGYKGKAGPNSSGGRFMVYNIETDLFVWFSFRVGIVLDLNK